MLPNLIAWLAKHFKFSILNFKFALLTSLLVKLKHSCPWIWRGVEAVNSSLVRARYPRIKSIAEEEARHIATDDSIEWSLVTPDDAERLSAFLTSIPLERKQWFDPHPFDAATLRRMASGHSFVMLKVTKGNEIVGYHFLRCFFIGKAFHGLIVSESAAGHGIGTRMWSLGAAISARAGLMMEATISESNLPSLTSCRRGCRTTVLSTLPGGYLHLRCEKNEE